MVYQQYMSCEVMQYLYAKVTEFPYGNSVANFWRNLLPGEFFRKSNCYSLENEARPLEPINQILADWIIVCVKNKQIKRIILMGNGHKLEGTASTAWASARIQLTSYMKLVWAETPAEPYTLYGLVTIGTYTKFYQLDPQGDECIHYPGTNGESFEIAKDEDFIQKVLLEMKEKTNGS